MPQVGTELKNALGTASIAFVNASLTQLVEAAKLPGGHEGVRRRIVGVFEASTVPRTSFVATPGRATQPDAGTRPIRVR